MPPKRSPETTRNVTAMVAMATMALPWPHRATQQAVPALVVQQLQASICKENYDSETLWTILSK